MIPFVFSPLLLCFLILILRYMFFIDFRETGREGGVRQREKERKREGERERQRERESLWLVASQMCPD